MEDELGVPNVNFVPCVKIVKQGVSKPDPVQIQLSRKELEQLNKNIGNKLNINENGEESENDEEQEDDFDLEHYNEENEVEMKITDVAVYDENDPYKSAYLDLPDSEEEDDIIKPSDNLVLVGHVEGSSGVLEVYVYNEKEGSFYVHHDYLLPSLPLALEWLNHDPSNTTSLGNLCAVGYLSPIIEVWDLDIINCVEPAFKLGKKGSRRRGRPRVGHKDAVLDLSWNKNFHHILASGSADESLILWDLDKGEPNTTISQFQDKVQSLIWHPFEGQTLLAGSADKTCRVFDCRVENTCKSWKAEGEVERVLWNHFSPFQFFSTDDLGNIYGFDCRQDEELWKIPAHSKEVTGLALSCSCPGLLLTASQDGNAKVWDIQSEKPDLVVEKNLKIGCIHCLESAPDLPFLFACGGDNKSRNLVIFNSLDKNEVKERFQGRSLLNLLSGLGEEENSKRVITYGSNRILKYLIWKHEKRLATGQITSPKEEFPHGKKSFFRRYVSFLIGSGVLGLFIVRRVHPDYRKPGKEASKWEVTVYTLLPLRIMSRLWGVLTNIDLPVFIRPKIYTLYANSFGVNLDECQVQDLSCYRNLSEFFIRPLKEECRPINPDCTCIVSPADGRVLTFGKITSCQVDQVKGVTYSLQQFLGKQSWRKVNNKASAKNTSTSVVHLKEMDSSSPEEEPSDEETSKLSITGFPGYVFQPSEAVSNLSSRVYLERLKENTDTDLYQCVVYLAPGDYHRFHSPVSWKVKFRRHFQGKLLSVNPAIASWINNLFSLNERAVYVGSWEHGFFSLTAVGATNVGFIKVVFDPLLQTNRWIVTPREQDLYFKKDCENSENESESKVNFGKPVEIKKGELFGEFRLGSTIVLIFEAPKNFQFNVEKGQKIKFGEKIGAYRM